MMETLLNDILELITNPGVVIVGAVTLIQVSPIKIDPWSAILKWIGDKLTGDIRKDLQACRDEVGNIRKDTQACRDEITEMKVQNWRWNVLDFANSCKNGRRHTLDDWKHAISQLAEYERYIERNGITNGVFEEDAHYLRSEYQKHCRENDFL